MYKKIRMLIRNILRTLPDQYYLRMVYFFTFKRKLNLEKPKYWTEKMQYKKLYDRRGLTTQVADKVRVREYAIGKLGKDIMPKIFWVGKDPEDIPFNNLPNEFVIKSNHGSGTNMIVRDKNSLDKKAVIDTINTWLNTDYYYPEKEWAYKNIERKVFVEELRLDNNNQVPADIKLYMFNGTLGAINIHYDRLGQSHTNIITNEKFEPINKDDIFGKGQIKIEKPKSFDTMIEYASKLSSEFDFIRVDFYDLGDEVILGELTDYPVGGFKRMPESLDKYLGDLWEVPSEYSN